MMIPVAEDAGRRLGVDVNIVVPDFTGDRQLLTQALVNLIGNAIKYGGDTITVSLDASEEGVSLHVVDNGPGIAPEDRSQALRRFGRLDTAREAAGGHGLGLPLVEAIARLHRGRLTLGDAAPGLGVSLILPRR
jgi:signal transduction histidine kinase